MAIFTVFSSLPQSGLPGLLLRRVTRTTVKHRHVETLGLCVCVWVRLRSCKLANRLLLTGGHGGKGRGSRAETTLPSSLDPVPSENVALGAASNCSAAQWSWTRENSNGSSSALYKSQSCPRLFHTGARSVDLVHIALGSV